ncbi:DUF4229 domain-containing protein [Isoptericola jiangsuensis]|uniref:DUF4229 domain-containing protein n=1 Tax=Isoptericola jiangsuensis TaxID=548579 RepID=UPI003AAD6A74
MPLVTYTVLRLLLFAAALGLAYVVGVRGWLLAVVALVVSFAVSYLALPKQKDAAAAWLAARSERRAQRRGGAAESLDSRIAEDAAAEDAVFDGTAPEGTASVPDSTASNSTASNSTASDRSASDGAESPNKRSGA